MGANIKVSIKNLYKIFCNKPLERIQVFRNRNGIPLIGLM